MQAVGGDPPRGRGHLAQWAQHPARDDPARRHRHHRHHAKRDRRAEQVLIRLCQDNRDRPAAELADCDCEPTAPTPLVMVSRITADKTNKPQYRAVKRIRTLRSGGSIIAISHSDRIEPVRPASACPAGPYTDITAAVRPV